MSRAGGSVNHKGLPSPPLLPAPVSPPSRAPMLPTRLNPSPLP